MLRSPEIWDTIFRSMEMNTWVRLGDIYKLIEKNCKLDPDDFLPQSPGSNTPKWKRNVRNVLQRRKTKGDINWDGNGKYLLRRYGKGN